MNFNNKNKGIIKTKYNLSKIMNNNNIFVGSGGSNNIIIIHNSLVFKVIPDFKKSILLKKKLNNDQIEIKFYEFFTDQFLKKNITPHLVGIYYKYKLDDFNTLLPKNCLNESQKLLTKPDKLSHITSKLCFLKKLSEVGNMLPKADVVVLENCPTTIEKELRNILNKKQKTKNKIQELQEFVDRTIFQFMYTLSVIQKLNPRFIHNDLFLRNVLGVTETSYCNNDYVEYIFNNKHYYLPANGFYLKINDFGYSLNPPKITSTLFEQIKNRPTFNNAEIDDKLRDIFTFLFDYYDGANLGSTSVMKLLEKSGKMKKYLRNTFKKYINVKIIDKINKINRDALRWLWNIKDVDILRKTVLQADKYFSKNIFKKYNSLPIDAKVVFTFKI